MNIRELDKQYIAGTYKRFPVVAMSGKGSVITDENGKTYIDMGSGIGVTSFGIADEIWQKAVCDQLSRIQHASNLYYTEPCVTLAQMLCQRTGMKKVFFSNSGAEANECAIKAARKYAADKYGNDRHVIATLRNSFHGRTLTTLAATGQAHYHELFTPLTEGFVSFDAGDLSAVEKLNENGTLAAIMIECVQGEGGVIPLEPGFVRRLAAFCQKSDVLLIVDEVQTGNGRTGKLYAYMHYGIVPDIVSTAKGLGGGLPLGATLLGPKCESVFSYGDHGSTFGGNPVSCAAAVSVLKRIDEPLLENVRRKSRFIFDSLSGADGIEAVSGLGLMIGIKTKKAASQVVNECLEKGVLCLTAKDKVRLLPALNIPDETLAAAISVVKEVCQNGE
ncbi:MAG: acetylornithine/succinylornithine family transaminase [Eubacteriales bacterium]|nr:acetylornithine/succinylornithine family transaminase [Eubacteriales bacterium]